MTSELLFVGTELLIGQIVNTNAAYLSRRLASLGVGCYHQAVVGDHVSRIAESFTQAISRSDVVIVTGGLGPTGDDITKTGLAQALGLKMIRYPQAESMVRAAFEKMHKGMTLNNLSQADFPEGTVLLENPNGTAPGVRLECENGCTVFLLPGVPYEMKAMFDMHIAPFLQKRSGVTLVNRYIRIFGMGESEVDEKLRDVIEQAENPSLAPYCGTGEVTLRATARAANEAEGEKLLAPLIEKVQKTLGSVVYSILPDESGSMARTCVELLLEKRLTCATAESLTGGKVASAIVDISGASGTLLAGLVTYAPEMKTAIAGVQAEIIGKYGVVSRECAEAMALGAAHKTGADIAVSTTGLAGPDGGTKETPVGTVFVAVARKGQVQCKKLLLSGSRERIRTLATLYALNGLRMAALETNEK